MPDHEQNHFPTPSPRSMEKSAKQMEISHEMVMAVADRVYIMLLQQMKIDAERSRLLNGFHKR